MGDLIEYDSQGVLTSIPNDITTITIKSSCTGFRSTGQDDSVFKNVRTSLKTVNFEENSQLTSVSPYCFYECRLLSFIDLSKCTQLYSIGTYAFTNCKALQTIDFPPSLTKIYAKAFQSSGLKSITIPANVDEIVDHAFGYCSSLASITFVEGSKLKSIGSHIFVYGKITSFEIPESVTSFSATAIDGCTSIERFTVHEKNNNFYADENGVLFNDGETLIYAFPPTKTGTYNIPNGITTLKTTSFFRSQLSTVVFPEGLTTIESYCFTGSSISQLFFSSQSLTTIGTEAFTGCTNLVNITFNEGLKSIADKAFNGCTNLQNVIFPSTLKTLGGGVFNGCNNVKISFGEDSEYRFDNEHWWIVKNDNTSLSQCLMDDQTEYKIPNTYLTIGTASFYEKQKLEHIKFESGSHLTTIDKEAFYNCINLQTFEFPESLISINEKAFTLCKSLQSINLSQLNSLAFIGNYAFQYCRDSSSIILPSLKETQTLRITQEESQYITLGNYSFFECRNVNNIDLGDKIQTIGQYCFQNCYLIESVVITESCSWIGAYAFNNCTSLKWVTFQAESAIETFPTYLFNNCTNLTEIKEYPQNLKTIESYAFSRTALSHFEVPESIETIGYSAFESCTSLVNFTIPENSSLVKLQGDIFNDCKALESIYNHCPNFTTWEHALFDKNLNEMIILPPASDVVYFSFPPNMSSIGVGALQNAKSLEVVFLHSNITNIGSYSFRNCSKLRYVNIPISVSTIGINVFDGCRRLQCGLSIQNQTAEFKQRLIDAGLLHRCLQDCNYLCTGMSSPKISYSPIGVVCLIFTRSK